MAGQNTAHWQGGPKDKANRSTTEGFLAPYYKSIKDISFADVPFETPIPKSGGDLYTHQPTALLMKVF
jgi:isoquinoline 1-oxidoreductase beta subunit